MVSSPGAPASIASCEMIVEYVIRKTIVIGHVKVTSFSIIPGDAMQANRSSTFIAHDNQ
jgi:hypothetical protein